MESEGAASWARKEVFQSFSDLQARLATQWDPAGKERKR
jgi:hypothetical protein